jgi:endonuclease/exonuclease/phosphatase family metal-dependent hydrolase
MMLSRLPLYAISAILIGLPVNAAAMAAASRATVASEATAIPQQAPRPLRIAAWNLEHLAEADGSGCRPRTEADYAQLRAYVMALNADVIAFQEVESAAAAARVFDSASYRIFIEAREGSARRSPCRGRDGLTLNAQRTGFAVRRDLAVERYDDLTALQLGDPDLRSGVDILVRPNAGEPVRLLSVHLKSGCSAGATQEACPTLFEQVPVLEAWIDARAAEGTRFAVLGDFNRRLALPGDTVWADWDDGVPAEADLELASGQTGPRCNPRFRDFIDFIVLDRRAASDLIGFEEKTFSGEALSDHCAVTATLSRE